MNAAKTAIIAGITILLYGLSLWVLADTCHHPGRNCYYPRVSNYIALTFVHITFTAVIAAFVASFFKYRQFLPLKNHQNSKNLKQIDINVTNLAIIGGIVDLFFWTTYNMCIVVFRLSSVYGLLVLILPPVTIWIVIVLLLYKLYISID